ncbi:hypothetical protein [Bradyrhizobium sp. HKCCYLS2033]
MPDIIGIMLDIGMLSIILIMPPPIMVCDELAPLVDLPASVAGASF